jgi:glycosyltransferase involved in cell wall biosynthesis
VAPQVASGGAARVGVLMHQLDGHLTGVGRYMASLTAELCRRDHGVDVFPLVVGALGALDSDPHVRRRITTDPQVRRALALTRRASRVAGHRASFLTIGSTLASIAARRLRLDVLHDLTGIAPFLLPAGPCRRVITVHDLISYLPDGGNDLIDDALQRRWLPRAARAADGIVTVSATTSADVQRLLHVPADRVHVARHGVDSRYRVLSRDDIEPTLGRHGISPGYILFIGSASPRKNLARLVRACHLIWADGRTTQLVVAGPARSAAVPGAAADIAAGRIAWVGYVPEGDLPALYNGAAVLAFPSSYEGFGLPALEAMSCGTPVLAGRAGALPEVVGDAGVLVDPVDVNAMARELVGLLEDSGRRSRLRELGLERARSFTWSRTADDTTEIYRHVMHTSFGEHAADQMR